MKADVYQKITDAIVVALEQGVRPWQKPWTASHGEGRITRPLRANGQPYHGINVLMLWSAALERGFKSRTWMTFRQALALGGCVRKGETGTLVVYADKIVRTETNEQGQEAEHAIPFMKGYTVFNVEQIDGLPAQFYGKPLEPLAAVERIGHAEAFFAATGVQVDHGGSQACYIPSLDRVRMPAIEFFRDAEGYYATLGHECIHWTRHASRLARDFGRKRFGDQGYAMEELVAELGAAFLMADLGLTPDIRDDHASYVANWIKVLKNDKRAIFTAASYAQRAADFLHARQPDAQEKAA